MWVMPEIDHITDILPYYYLFFSHCSNGLHENVMPRSFTVAISSVITST